MFKKLKEQKACLAEKRGFTLIELLIVIAIIAIIAAVVFVALDPLTRFQDSRDSSRWTDSSAILNAIKVDQVDNGGAYLGTVDVLVAGDTYMIGTGVAGCDTPVSCDVTIDNTACVNLTGLVTEGYLGSVPISTNGAGTWYASSTGYTLTADATGIITVQACESENVTGDIKVSR